ncbi:MAG: hypothetical protein WAU86_07000 [Oricola sp.]
MWGSKVSAYGSRRRKSSSVAVLAATAAALAGAALPVMAADIYEIGLPQPVTAIRKTDDASYVVIGTEIFQLVACETPEGVCLSTTSDAGELPNAPKGALPDGHVAIAHEGDIRNAWYARPTERYAHGVLGDAIEGGSLVVVTGKGGKHEFVLPENQVFEDITPRIRDLDGDGANEVVAIRSSLTGGSAVAIYGLRDGELAELGASSENGAPNRWLNVAAIVVEATGKATVYAVRTPHIGGQLFSLSYSSGAVTESATLATDVSNHVIGSRELGLAAAGDLDGSGKLELVIPSQDRTKLRFPLSQRPDIALPGAVDKAMAIINGRIVTATADGKLLAIQP